MNFLGGMCDNPDDEMMRSLQKMSLALRLSSVAQEQPR